MKRKSIVLILCLLFVAGILNISLSAAPADGDLSKQYPVSFETRRVDGRSPMSLTQIGNKKIQLVTDIIDGGGITKETVTVKKVETTPDQVTVIHVLYTIDGQPNKAFFTREMKAVIQVPASGKYRVKLWINELFHQNGENFSGEKEIQVK